MLLTASQIIQQTWRIYIKHFKNFIPYALILGLVLFLSSFTKLIQPIEYKYGLITNNGVILFVGTIIFVAIVSFLSLWVSSAFSLAIKDSLDNEPIRNFKDALKTSRSFLWPLLYTSLLVGLIILGGTLAVIIPGIIFSVWYVFSSYEVMFNKTKGLAALRASKALVVGRWWKIVWRLLVPSFVFGIGMWILLIIGLLPLNLHYISKVDTTSIQARVNYLIIQGDGDISKLSSSEQKKYLMNYHPEILLPLPILILNNLITSVVYMIVFPLTYTTFIILYFNAKENPVPKN